MHGTGSPPDSTHAALMDNEQRSRHAAMSPPLATSSTNQIESYAVELAGLVSSFAREDGAPNALWLCNSRGDSIHARRQGTSVLVLANWRFEAAHRGQGLATRVLELLELHLSGGDMPQNVMYIENVGNPRFLEFLRRRPGWELCHETREGDEDTRSPDTLPWHADLNMPFGGSSFAFRRKVNARDLRCNHVGDAQSPPCPDSPLVP